MARFLYIVKRKEEFPKGDEKTLFCQKAPSRA